MASANWMKVKGGTHAKAIMQHCDKDQRLQHDHSNKDIDKNRTPDNWTMRGLSYAEVCAVYDARIARLDSVPGANKRKDRVTCVFVDVPAPAGLPADQYASWFGRVWDIWQDRTGGAGIEGWVHVDEIHDYIANGQAHTSRAHMHIGAVPEVGGRLCGKEFSARRNMVALNNAIDKMSREEYGIQWMDGTGRKSTESVEELKGRSAKELQAWERSLQEREDAVAVKEQTIDKKLDQASDLLEQARSLSERVDQRAAVVSRIQNRTAADVAPDWIDNALPWIARPLKRVLKSSYTDYKIARSQQAAEDRQAQWDAVKQAETDAATDAAIAAAIEQMHAEEEEERRKRLEVDEADRNRIIADRNDKYLASITTEQSAHAPRNIPDAPAVEPSREIDGPSLG